MLSEELIIPRLTQENDYLRNNSKEPEKAYNLKKWVGLNLLKLQCDSAFHLLDSPIIPAAENCRCYLRINSTRTLLNSLFGFKITLYERN